MFGHESTGNLGSINSKLSTNRPDSPERERQIVNRAKKFANFRMYLKELLTVRPFIYDLRRTDILSLPKPATTTYGLHSFKYCAVKLWNSLPDDIRRECTLTSVKCLLITVFSQESY